MESGPIIGRPRIPPDTPSFGIEFEFLIAFLKNPEIPNPNPSDPRTVYFPPTAEDDVTSSFEVPPGKENWASEWSIYAHIKRSLLSVGLPTEPGKAHSNFNVWEITTDGSIERPKPPSTRNKKAYNDWRTYSYYPLEVRTPAYYYSEDALIDIADFCKVMRENYLVTVNDSCGLHVHIGYGLSGFELPHLRRLGALIQAFEPQFDSIHPAHRIDDQNTHCTSFRRGTYYQRKFRQEQQRIPRVLEALSTVLACSTRDQFRAFVASEGPTGALGSEGGTSAWNFDRMGTEIRPKVGWVQDTIEFHGHEGSLDPDVVGNWTSLLVGLVRYTKDPHMLEFGNLLQRVTGEKWVKEFLDVKATGERYGLGGKMYRPVFGEQWCGLVELFRILGLEGPAKYYENRKGKYLENGVYTHWYRTAPAEYTVLADGDVDDGDEGSDAKDSEESKTSDDSPPSDSSSGQFSPFNPNPNPNPDPNPNPEAPPGAEPEPGDNDGDNQIQGQDNQGQDQGEGQGQDEDQPTPSETKSAPASSSEEFPVRPGAKKLEEVGAANNPPSGHPSSKDSQSIPLTESSEFINPIPPPVPEDAQPVPVDVPVPRDLGKAAGESGAVSVVPDVPQKPLPTFTLPPAPKDSLPPLPPGTQKPLPTFTFPVPDLPGFDLPPAPTDSLPAPTPSGKGALTSSPSHSHKSSKSNSKSRSKSTDSSKGPDKTSSEYEAEALAAKEVLRKFWEDEKKREEEEEKERKENERQRSSMNLGSMGGAGSERSMGSGSLDFEDPGPRDEEEEMLVPWQGAGLEDEKSVEVDKEEEKKKKKQEGEKQKKEKEQKKKEEKQKEEYEKQQKPKEEKPKEEKPKEEKPKEEKPKEEKPKEEKPKEEKPKEEKPKEEKDTDEDAYSDDSLRRPRAQYGVENPASEEGDGLEYLVVTGETKLLTLLWDRNYNFRTANQHSHLHNGATPKQIHCLAPNVGNAIGSRFHRRDRKPSSPWLKEAPDIAGMNPNRMPYPGPYPWLGTPNYPLFQARAQLADALYEEEISTENDDGIWRAKGNMGQTWDIQHGEPATRSEKLRRMLEGLKVEDVSPTIKDYLRFKSQQHARQDYYNNPDHLFPPAANTLEEFERNDDDWWRFEVACMTMNDLFEKSEDADDGIAEDACEAILRIGGADGTGHDYWPEGAQNPFANQPRTQEPVLEDVSPHANVPGIHFPHPGQSEEGFWESLGVMKEEEEEKRRQKEQQDEIGKKLREQGQKIMEEMRKAEEEMEKRRRQNLPPPPSGPPPPVPPRSELRPPPLPQRPVDPKTYKTYNPER